MNVILRVGRYVFRYPGQFFLTLGLAIGMTLLGIFIPQVFRFILDGPVAEGHYESLLWGVLLAAGMYFGQEALNCLRIRVNNTLEQRVLIDLRRDVHAKLLDLPVSFYDKRKSGEISSRVIEDVTNVERAILDGSEQGTVAVLTIIGVAALMFSMNPALASLVLLPIPILFWLGTDHVRKTRRNWRAVRDAAGELNSLLVEDIQGNRLIHSFALRKREYARFEDRAQTLRQRTLKAMYRWSVYGPGTTFVANLGAVAVIGGGGYLLISTAGQPDAFTEGEFVAFFAYCGMFYQPVRQLIQLTQMISTGQASGDRVFEIIDHPSEITSPPHPKPFPAGPVEIRYEHMQFGYEGRPPVFQDFNLSLPAGKVTALVGHTGAGKSTLANLLLRYYEATGGAVTYNGVDVREFDLDELRTHVGVVAQDPFLFDGTIRENLLLARPEATEEVLVEALSGACIWDFIEGLPEGMETLIGEKGIRLSMGEKQRLTIARVLLKNPPVVIFDEATSSVDTITERHIQSALENLARERTVLVIAHRLSTIREASQIVVLERGRILEQGGHEELLGQQGYYWRLWQHQADAIPEFSPTAG